MLGNYTEGNLEESLSESCRKLNDHLNRVIAFFEQNPSLPSPDQETKDWAGRISNLEQGSVTDAKEEISNLHCKMKEYCE